ncbi:MAG: glycosyltransferase [Eubacteriales bacterium]|nr:glycosyltransferase [Eubacteriales bacterium]
MKNRIKVVEIISDTNFGGAGQYLKSIVEEIDKERFDLTVIMPVGSVLKDMLGDIPIEHCRDINEKSFSFKGTCHLCKMMKMIRPSVVHTHGSLSGRLAAQLLGVRNIVYTKHTLSDNSVLWKRKLKKILNSALRAKVIAISASVKLNLIEEGIKEDNIRMIYNGIRPIETFDNETRLIPIITLVGRLEAIKGHRHMIEITRQLVDCYDEDFEVRFVGSGSLESTLKDIVTDYGLPISFSGHVSNIGEIYETSDIIVNTSDSEALSYAALEAMIHKKPVVAFDIPGINEVIENGKTGFLVDYKNYGLFAECLVQLLSNNTLRRNMGELGRKRAIDKFSLKEMINGIETLYMEEL